MNNVYDFKFYPSLILRTPAYSYQCYGDPEIQKLLEEPFFKSAIYLASSSLYEALKKKNFRHKELSNKEQLAVKRYLNRMCFRPTPFGLFAGFSMIKWGHQNSMLQLGQDKKAHINFSQGYSALLAGDILRSMPSYQTFVANNSIYRVGNEYRYIRYDENSKTGDRNFYIDSFSGTEILSNILPYAKGKRTMGELVQFVMIRCETGEREAQSFVEQLIAKQIILSTLMPNITGEAYIGRVMGFAQKIKGDFPYLSAVRSKINKLGSISHNIHKMDLGEELSDWNYSSEAADRPHSDLVYVNLENPDVHGSLSTTYQQKILDGLYCIDKLLPDYPTEALQELAAAFTRKFGLRTVPLLQALDPEAGVDYASLAVYNDAPVLFPDIQAKRGGNSLSLIEWTPVHKLLMNKWNSLVTTEDGVDYILLKKEDIEKLPDSNQEYLLPPGISVLFRTMGDKVYIEKAGGASALALSGRFTPFNESLHIINKEIAGMEAIDNPKVVFAEIAHFGDQHTANINRRETMRAYEIPIMTGSCLDNQFLIPLNDLYVNVQGGRIFLWSEKLRKSIIPRLSSAYNYTRSSLPVFRFLCDLQSQGIKTNFSFDLSFFFPGLSHYPRVQYESAILHLATWNIQREQWPGRLGQKSKEYQIAALKDWLTEIHCPKYISVNESDNQIILDHTRDTDMEMLLRAAKNKETIVIKEFPFLYVKKSIVTDEGSRPFNDQFVASLFHHEKTYEPPPPPTFFEEKPTLPKRQYLPGSEWLYFKIYCHPSRSNDLLVQYIAPPFQYWKQEGILKQWFFIHYRDPEYHVRIRANINPHSTQKLMIDINEKCASLIHDGMIHDYQIAIYARELERYGPDLIEEVEAAFCAGSIWVIKYLNATAEGDLHLDNYGFAIVSIEIMLDVFNYSLPDKETLFYQLYYSFSREFESSAALNDKLKRKFRELKGLFRQLPEIADNDTLFGPSCSAEAAIFRNAYTLTANKINGWPMVKKNKLTGDLIHTHVNRLFPDKQRKHEMVLYYCLWRYYRSVRLRQ